MRIGTDWGTIYIKASHYFGVFNHLISTRVSLNKQKLGYVVSTRIRWIGCATFSYQSI